jgi:hypothetical protein
MDYYYKYLKYKYKYLNLKDTMHNSDMTGGKRKTQTKWSRTMLKRKKELANLKTTRSFVPFNKLTNKDKVYYVHDNGGRPFKVVANSKGIQIYKEDYVEYEDRLDNYEPTYGQMIFQFKNMLGYWTGFDSSPYKMNGNSILIKISDNKYVSVGWEIYQFETDDEIVDYVSPVGNSDVPYPVAFGEKDVYFMLDKQLVKHDELETEVTVANAEDLYGEFYGHIGSKKKIPKLPMKNVVMLQERIVS